MNRILHIFRKDAIRLWPQLLVFLALLVSNAWEDRKFAREVPNGPSALQLLAVLLPIACSVLLVTLIHQERLVGDRQYWLSRPMPRRDLILAKGLFVLVLINLPVLLSQIAIVKADGLSGRRIWPDLLTMQLFFTAVQILPVAALAAVTKNMVQAVFAALAVAALVGLAAVSWAGGFIVAAGLIWIEVTLAASVLVVGSIAVLRRQYFRHGVMLSRALLTLTLVLAFCSMLIPHSVKWAIQMKFSPQRVDANDMRIAEGSGSGTRVFRKQDQSAPEYTPASLEFDLRFLRPQGDGINPEGFQATAELPSGQRLNPVWRVSSIRTYEGVTSLWVDVDRDFYSRVKDKPVHFYGAFDFTVLADVRIIPVPWRRAVTVAGIGRCFGPPEDLSSSLMYCDSTSPRVRIMPAVGGEPPWDGSSAVLAPFPYSPGYSPLTSVAVLLPDVRLRPHPTDGLLLVQKPIAYLQRRFDFGKIVLSDYELSTSNAYFVH